jgi:hypothetical protein
MEQLTLPDMRKGCGGAGCERFDAGRRAGLMPDRSWAPPSGADRRLAVR